MKVFGGVAPECLASGFTTAYALGMTGYCAFRDVSTVIEGRARSWYENSEGAEIVHITKGLASILCVGPARSAAVRLGLSKEEEEFPYLDLAKIFIQGALYVGRRAVHNIFAENPWGIVETPLFFLATGADVAAGMIEHYEATHQTGRA